MFPMLRGRARGVYVTMALALGARDQKAGILFVHINDVQESSEISKKDFGPTLAWIACLVNSSII